MKVHSGFMDSFGFVLVDHRGGDLIINDGNIKVSIPDGALAKGKRTLVTVRVPNSPGRFPLQNPDVQITPAIVCSPVGFNLRKPAKITMPNCLRDGHQSSAEVSLCTMKQRGKSIVV